MHHQRRHPARLAREAPAEAARGEELLAGVRRMFDVEAEYPGGQGLLHPLLSGLARNFGGDPAADERLRAIASESPERFAEVPGVGPTVSAALATWFGPAAR